MITPRTRVVPFLALAVLLAACREDEGSRVASRATGEPGSSPAAAPGEEGVLAELRRYYADFSERDWTAFRDHFWPGATITTIWQAEGELAPTVQVQTIPEFVRAAPEGPGSQPIFSETMRDARIRVHGALAQAWVTYDAEFGEPDDLMTWSGIDAFNLLKHDGRWRIVSLAFVPDG